MTARERVVALVADLTETLSDPTQAWDIAVADFNHEVDRLVDAAEQVPDPPAYNEEKLDALAREMYQMRSQSPREMTDERWALIKERFPGSVRTCREAVIDLHDDEL